MFKILSNQREIPGEKKSRNGKNQLLTSTGGWIKLPYSAANRNGKLRLYICSRGQESEARLTLQREKDQKHRILDTSLNHLEQTLPFKPYLLKNGRYLRLISQREAGTLLSSGPSVHTFTTITDPSGVRPDDGNRIELDKMYSRLASVDQLNREGNTPLTTLDDYSELEKTTAGYRFKNSPSNPFRATLINGQVRWKSIDPVTGVHVKQVVDFAISLGRKLHINTGTHGDQYGNTVIANIDYGESIFSKEDLTTAWNLPNVSVHIVSQNAPSFHPGRIDVVDAWCWSDSSQHSLEKDKENIFTVLFKFLSDRSEKLSMKASASGKNSQAIGTIQSESGDAIGVVSGQGGNSTFNGPVSFGPTYQLPPTREKSSHEREKPAEATLSPKRRKELSEDDKEAIIALAIFKSDTVQELHKIAMRSFLKDNAKHLTRSQQIELFKEKANLAVNELRSKSGGKDSGSIVARMAADVIEQEKEIFEFRLLSDKNESLLDAFNAILENVEENYGI